MKLDKDFLIKQKFWVVLGGGLFLTLLAIFFLLVIAPGAIGKVRKKVEEDWGRVKNAKDVKNPEIIKVMDKLKESEKGNEEVAWRRGYESQKKIPFWPFNRLSSPPHPRMVFVEFRWQWCGSLPMLPGGGTGTVLITLP